MIGGESCVGVWVVWDCGCGVGVVVLCKLDERGETRPRSDVM